MPSLTIELPSQAMQNEFNLRRWAELLDEPELAKVEGRIETDRHGHIIMSPPPAADHGSYQSEIAFLLRQAMKNGRVLTECPISTADGVKAADVAWASPECLRILGRNICFPRSPEICVEVLSPVNTQLEINEKVSLYFDAGAVEVWLCDAKGVMTFLKREGATPFRKSVLCPTFPERVQYQ